MTNAGLSRILIGDLVGQLAGWLSDWLVGCLVGWLGWVHGSLTSWLAVWLVGFLTARMYDSLASWSVIGLLVLGGCWVYGSLVGHLLGSTIHWLADCQVD